MKANIFKTVFFALLIGFSYNAKADFFLVVNGGTSCIYNYTIMDVNNVPIYSSNNWAIPPAPSTCIVTSLVPDHIDFTLGCGNFTLAMNTGNLMWCACQNPAAFHWFSTTIATGGSSCAPSGDLLTINF